MRGAWVEIVIIGTHTLRAPAPLTAASTLTKCKVCADHPFVTGAPRTHNENRTEVLCPRVTQAAMIAAASFGLRRSGTFATAQSGAAYWAASVRHGPPWPLPVNAPKSIFQDSILYRAANSVGSPPSCGEGLGWLQTRPYSHRAKHLGRHD
jgi:hypothetical protein